MTTPTPRDVQDAESLRLQILNCCLAVAGKNEGDLRKATDMLLEATAAKLAAARAEEREECAVVADTEPVPDESGPAPIEMLAASPVTAAIAGVIATKKCIAERIRARTNK